MFITRKVRNVTPHITGTAASTRRPSTRRSGERAARASRPDRLQAARRCGGAGADALIAPAPDSCHFLAVTSSQSTLEDTTTAGSGMLSPGPLTFFAKIWSGAQENRNGPYACFAM